MPRQLPRPRRAADGGGPRWTKLSDDFSDDCWELSDKAFRLHVEGLCWSTRKLNGQVLLKDEMRRWAKHPDAAEELVARGYRRDEGHRYVVVHHAAYQRRPEKVLAQQDANRRNGRKGGRPHGFDIRPPETDSVSDSLGEPETERDWTGLALITGVRH